MKSFIKSIGWTFLVAIGIVPFVIILIIYLSHSNLPVDNTLNWVSLLGAIVGGIGAIGGIIVGMISLITLSQIDKQVKAAFAEQYENHRKSLDEQSSKWATGIHLWTLATVQMVTDPTTASQTLNNALEIWPTAPLARTEMLKRLYEETERAYLLDLVPGRRQNLISMDSLRSLNNHQTYHSWPNSYLDDSLRWWTLAEKFKKKAMNNF